jgi:hypothetical protein
MAVTGYELSRDFWNFSFENPDKITPTHIGIYFFAIEHCNRLGWKEKFGFPTSMVLDAIGLKSYNTFKKHFDDLVSWGFIKVIEYSKNQYSANIIALSKNNKANVKALDKALAKHLIKHVSKQSESTGSIDKPKNQEPITREQSLNQSDSRRAHRKKIEEVTEFWQAHVDVWFKFYESKKKEPPTFSGPSQKSLKAIVKNLKKRSTDKGRPWDEKTGPETLQMFLEYAYNLNWIKDNFLLTNLERQFDKIITSNGQQESSNNKKRGQGVANFAATLVGQMEVGQSQQQHEPCSGGSDSIANAW